MKGGGTGLLLQGRNFALIEMSCPWDRGDTGPRKQTLKSSPSLEHDPQGIKKKSFPYTLNWQVKRSLGYGGLLKGNISPVVYFIQVAFL